MWVGRQLRKRIGPFAARLPFGRFGRGVSVLAGGAALGQLVLVLSSPIVTRIYTPEDFGTYAVYGAIVAIIGSVAAWRYEYAIPLPDDERDAANVLVLGFLIVLAMVVLSSALLHVAGGHLVSASNASALSPYLWVVPLGILGSGCYRILNYWAIRGRQYGRIGWTKTYQGVAQSVVQVGLGLVGLGPGGLMVGQVAGQAAGSGRLSTALRKNWSAVWSGVTWGGVYGALRRYWKFPAFSGTGALLNSAGLYLPAALFSALYGTQVAGWFALGHRVIGLPVSVISRSVSQVYLGESTYSAADKKVAGIKAMFHRTSFRLALGTLGPATTMLIFAPGVFSFTFGEAWREAGVYVQLLVLMFAARFIVLPLTHTLNIIERQDRQFAWDAGRLILVVASIAGPAALGAPARLAVLSYSGAMCAAYIALYLMMIYSLARLRT